MKTIKHKKLEWGKPLEEPMSWDKAIEYCKSLGGGWRLPTVNELQSIVSYKKVSPALKKKFIERFNGVVPSYYWSSTAYTYVNDTSYAWYVSIGYGGVNYDNKAYCYYVWPVRNIPKKIKPIEKLYGVIHDGHRIPAQVHHSLDRLKKVNNGLAEYKIVEYKLKDQINGN